MSIRFRVVCGIVEGLVLNLLGQAVLTLLQI